VEEEASERKGRAQRKRRKIKARGRREKIKWGRGK
jgi:hypothetical protein